ncbi:hypothetical protein V565_029090, partial [Rhizoctonia solani 123E]
MAAYASPPRSTGAASPHPSTKVLDSTFQALSQAPPPTIREILGAYSTKGEGDREMLVALLNAKSAEDQRIAAVAALQQTVLQMQHSLAVAQAQAASAPAPQQLPSPRSGPSPLMAPAPAPLPDMNIILAYTVHTLMPMPDHTIMRMLNVPGKVPNGLTAATGPQ